jgi:hypothetical protein
VSQRVKEQLLECLNMKEWKLPVKYLGLPLISKRLSTADFAILLEKISGRILGYQETLPLLVVCSCCLWFYIASKSISRISSFYLRRLLELLNKSSIGCYGMEMTVQPKQKYLGR